MNTFQSIIKDCKTIFGAEPSLYQLRLWFFGATHGQDKQKDDHRRHVTATIADWDVVIRLALRYTEKVIVQEHKKHPEKDWPPSAIWRFVYALIWSKFEMTKPMKTKTGVDFNGATWWIWAAEHRHDLKSVQDSKAPQHLKAILMKALNAEG